ncbi:Uncharacterised protein [Mycobacterium tuberculosis]|uniref:Uncharacterized protein n=1 Tax=Mycobacterium tuberculosis TaxID=1773 RepID=A0A655JDC8_MYCTX|nr:Uncharacterised protein [Mycobacterium tuberculosis]CKR57582.1 Uncharacterised protein [Mycobacterium tuberculosis]CKR65817.1 Uncharacterised protein [Mycobacterium tuberculosis]COW41667.1 Uncharacterised protein [Mycobacterium tuberculosis]COW75231.1 Uncharacterised protein [Mycobacterium tuberculosis]
MLCLIGHVIAYQFPCLAHRFVTELEAKLTGQLCPDEVDLTGTLHFDALRLDVGLGL